MTGQRPQDSVPDTHAALRLLPNCTIPAATDPERIVVSSLVTHALYRITSQIPALEMMER